MKQIFSFTLLITLAFSGFAQDGKDLLPVKIDYKWGFIDRTGKTIIEPSYDYTENFICNLAKVKSQGLYGVVDNSGKLVVPAEFVDISIFCPNFIAFKKDTLWGLDDATGYNILPANYQRIEYLDPKTFLLKKAGVSGMYNFKLTKSIEPVFTGVTVTGKGFYLVNKGTKMGIIDSTLEYTLQPEYSDVSIINSTTFLAKQKDFWGIISNKGQVVANFEFMAYKKYSNEFVGLKTKKSGWVLYSTEAQKVLETEEQESFTILDKDLVMLNKAHKHGIIDQKGTVILPQNYSNIHLNDGLLLVELGGKWGLTDRSGKVIIETVHTKLFPFKKSVAVFEGPEGKGIIDNKGKIIAQPIYTNIDLGNGTAKGTKADGSSVSIKLTGPAPTPVTKTSAKTAKPDPKVEEATSGHAWLKGPTKKWGLVGHDTVFVPFRFDEIIETGNNQSIIVQKIDYRTNQKMYGYINANKLNDLATGTVGLVNKATGQTIVKPTVWYIRTEDFLTGDNAKVVNEGGQQGLFSKSSGKMISELAPKDKKATVKTKLDYVGKFNGGIARFCTGCSVNFNGDWENGNKVTGGKWGYINQDAAIIQEPQFDEAGDFINGRAIVKIKGLYGLINTSGTYVLKTEYQNLAFIPEADNKFLKVENRKERYGLINAEGKSLTNISYDKIFPYKEGLARVVVNGKYGFIDESDKIVIEAKYDMALDFSEGLAAVSSNKKWGFIDKSGTQKILPSLPMVGSFKNGLAPVSKEGKIGYISPDEKVVIAAQFTKGTEFNGGVAIVTLPDGKSGVIDVEGKFILEPKYDEVKFFVNSRYLKAKFEGEVKFFDKNIQAISKKGFVDIGEFSEGLAWVKIDATTFNYIDTTGIVVIKKKLTAASPFSGGLAKVQSELKYGYINKKGDAIMDFIFPNCTDFNGDRAFIEGPNKLYGIIDQNGKHITYDKFISPKPFSNGFAVVMAPNKEFYFVDGKGNNLFGRQQFEQAFSFDNGIARVKLKKWGLVNTQGFHTLDYKYDYMTEFTEKQSVVGLYESIGILDLDGKMIAEPVFDSYSYLGTGVFRLERSDAVGYFSMDKNWLWPLRK